MSKERRKKKQRVPLRRIFSKPELVAIAILAALVILVAVLYH